MRKVHVIFTKDNNGNITLAAVKTDKREAWKLRDEYKRLGFLVNCESVELNKIEEICLNIWSRHVKEGE